MYASCHVITIWVVGFAPLQYDFKLDDWEKKEHIDPMLSIFKDMNWLGDLRETGQIVTLIGGGLKTLMSRYTDPGSPENKLDDELHLVAVFETGTSKTMHIPDDAENEHDNSYMGSSLEMFEKALRSLTTTCNKLTSNRYVVQSGSIWLKKAFVYGR